MLLPNKLIDKFIAHRIAGTQYQCLIVIMLKTYGEDKYFNKISLKHFSKKTGLTRNHAHRALKKLKQKQIIIITKNGIRSPLAYRINENYSQWKALPKKTTYQPISKLKKFCYICGYDKVTHRHHIKPLSEGGEDRVSNIAILCPNCHSLVHRGEFSSEFIITQKHQIERKIYDVFGG